jgi:exopolysaccharide biosynthesis polyprenyl glycosylphosphotransferase
VSTRSLRAFAPSRAAAAGENVVRFPGTEARTLEEQTPYVALRRREFLYRWLLATADFGSALVALVLALQLFGSDHLQPLAVLAAPLVVVMAKVQGLYDRDALVLKKTTLDEAPQIFGLATLYALIVSTFDQELIRGSLSSQQTVGIWLLLFATAVVFRTLARCIARSVGGVERVLVIGSAFDGERIAGKLAEEPKINARVIGRLPLSPADAHGDTLGASIDDLASVCAANEVHRVVVAPHGSSSEGMLDAIRAAKAIGVQVSVLPRLLEVIGSSVEFDHLNGITVMGLRRFGLSRSSSIVKRALDIAGAAAGLLVLGPLLVAIGLAVRLTSPGAALFRQVRIGRDGRPFRIVKFRTMVADADDRKDEVRPLNEAAEGLFKIADDPRITPIGKFLRRTSLDELPQLLNVLGGDMSLVGPRPLVEEEDKRIEGQHRRRSHLKPGMTGQWQIFGSSRIPLREMVTIDYLYVANWSLWGDIKILCRTLPYVLARRGL